MAWEALIGPAISAGSSILGGLFGGGEEADDTAMNQYNQAGILQAYNQAKLGADQQNKYNTGYDSLWGDYTNSSSLWNDLSSPYAQAILSDLSSTTDARNQMLGYGSRAYDKALSLLDYATPAYQGSVDDALAALKMGSDVYRPAESSNISWLQNTARPALGQGYADATQYYGDTRDLLGKANDYYDFSKTVVDPEQVSQMAGADIANEYQKAANQQARQQAAYGIDPSSGNSQALAAQSAVEKALATAGAKTQGDVAGRQQQFENIGTGLNALNSATSQVGQGQSAVNSSAQGLGNFGTNFGSMLQKGPMTTDISSTLQPFTQMMNGAMNAGTSALTNTAASQLASALSAMKPSYSTATSLVNTLGNFSQENIRALLDAYQKSASNATSAYGADSSSASSASQGAGSLLGSGLGTLANTNWSSLWNSGSSPYSGASSFASRLGASAKG